MPKLVSDPAAIDAGWLTEALREAGVLSTGRVRKARGRIVGTGRMGDNLRYELAYEDAPVDAPGSVIAKLPAADPTSRAGSAATGSYWREVHFYRELAPRIAMRTPRAYVALVHENRTDYVILMEDLAPAEPGDQIQGCGPERAELAVREAAKLHASLYESPSLASFEWITQVTREGSELGRSLLVQMWPGFVDRLGDGLSREALALGEQFARSFTDWSLAYRGPRTLVHADYRLENMLFGDGTDAPPIAVVDWQTCMHTGGLTDVAYFLGGGLSVQDRRLHERELVESYRRELAGRGVGLSAEDCWDQYRRFALHGILITVLGAMMTGQGDRSDRMFTAMIERHLQHGLDLECSRYLS
jgi:hypothetical protein